MTIKGCGFVPAESSMTPPGLYNVAAVAGPLSPELPLVLLPAIVVMTSVFGLIVLGADELQE